MDPDVISEAVIDSIIQVGIEAYREATFNVFREFMHNWAELARSGPGMAQFSVNERERALCAQVIDNVEALLESFSEPLDNE